MNKLLFLLAAMAVVLPVSAGGQFKSHGSQADYRPLSPDEITMNGNSLNMITDASDEIPVVISEVPEGTLLTYYRTGGYIYHKFMETGITEFEDVMNVVFAEDGKVYIQEWYHQRPHWPMRFVDGQLRLWRSAGVGPHVV